MGKFLLLATVLFISVVNLPRQIPVKKNPLEAWFFAEGSTQNSWNTHITVQNIGDNAADVTMTYFGNSGSYNDQSVFVLQPGMRRTVNVNDVLGVGHDFATSVVCANSQPILTERAMYWNTQPPALQPSCALSSFGTNTPAKTWYMADGSTGGDFQTYISVLNPNSTLSANVQFTYFSQSGSTRGPSVQLPPQSRNTVKVCDTLPGVWNVSTRVASDVPIVAERSMYWNDSPSFYPRSGHGSLGTTHPGTSWYFAEGSTGGSFETFVLLQNPNDQAATVNLTYMNSGGAIPGPEVHVNPSSNRAVKVNDTVANTWDVSTLVESDIPIVAERSMYWNSDPSGFSPAFSHSSVGSRRVSNQWRFAEGSTGAGFETFILVQNPSNQAATVEITYLTESGAVNGPQLNMPSQSRKTVSIGDTLPDSFSVSTRVTSDVPIVAERSMYWRSGDSGAANFAITQAAHSILGFNCAQLIPPQRKDLLGSWTNQNGVSNVNGVYSRKSADGSWQLRATPALQVAAGDLDGDGIDDLTGTWPEQGGIWTLRSTNSQWYILASVADWITCGDMNGDGLTDLVGSWANQGVFYKNSLTGTWVRLADAANQVAAGDLDGDTAADLIGIWPGQAGVWIKYSSSQNWTQLSTTADSICAGDMTGDGRADLLGSWSGQGVFCLDSNTSNWVYMGTSAGQVAAGDLDWDGTDDLVGTWLAQGGIFAKYSGTGQWGFLATQADWISVGRMYNGASAPVRGLISGYSENRLEAGPDLFSPHVDLRSFGPGGVRFTFKKTVNPRPGERIDIQRQTRIRSLRPTRTIRDGRAEKPPQSEKK